MDKQAIEINEAELRAIREAARGFIDTCNAVAKRSKTQTHVLASSAIGESYGELVYSVYIKALPEGRAAMEGLVEALIEMAQEMAVNLSGSFLDSVSGGNFSLATLTKNGVEIITVKNRERVNDGA